MQEQTKIKTTIMRGGTSKAVFLNETHVPRDAEARQRLLLSLFGSPDKRQIDGLGGADLLTSKCALMGPSTRADADVDYTFAQIGIDQPTISYEFVCGNISSAAAVYAVEEGYVRSTDPVTTVRIHNTNTKKVLLAKVQTRDGIPLVEGDTVIDGVPGSGAEVAMDYSGTSGGATGSLLPTGNVVDELYVPSLGRAIQASIVDVGTVCVFFRASDVGLTGTEPLSAIPAVAFQVAEELRLAVAERCKLPADSFMTPFQIMVAPATPYLDYAGTRTIEPSEVHFLAKMIGKDGLTHKAFPGGGTICTSVAARIEGTIVQQCASSTVGDKGILIGHPSGVIEVQSDVSRVGNEWTVNEVLFSRTARRLMEGYAFVRNSAL